MTRAIAAENTHPGPAVQDATAVSQRFDRWKDDFEKRKAALKPAADTAKQDER